MNNKVVLAVYNQIRETPKPYQEHLRHITYFSITLQTHLHKDIIYEKVIEGTDIDQIIQEAYNTGCEWIQFMSLGQRFFNHNITLGLLQLADKENYNIIGHPIQTVFPDQRLGYYELHPQFFFLNLKTWFKMGKPYFGKAGMNSTVLSIPERSKENFHDNYTPYWIKPTGKLEKYEDYLGNGWNLINTALKFGESIGSFTEEIKNSKQYLYPEVDSILFSKVLSKEIGEKDPEVEKNLSNYNQRAYLNQTTFNSYVESIYIYNTEQVKKEDIEIEKTQTPLHNLYTPASGFKGLTLLNQCNWSENTRVVYCDYSLASIKLKKWLLENWNGQEYSKALQKFQQEYEGTLEYIWKGYVNIDSVDDIKLVEKELIELENYFGGKERWLEFWEKYIKLPHSFVHCNFLGDYSSLMKDIETNPGNNLIWISNIFYSEPAIRNFQPHILRELYLKFTNDLQTQSNFIEITGAPPIQII